MNNKKIILTLITTLLISSTLFYIYEYNASKPIFKIKDCLFAIDGDIGNYYDDFKKIHGEEIGYINTKTYLVPKNNNEGFKIPKNSKVYSINKDYLDIDSYSVIIEIEENYYIASIYIDNKDYTSKYLETFDKNFRE